MFKSQNPVTEEESDVTFLAGWMYADLFLAMMVVFLATVTFIPEYIGNLDQSASNSAYNYQEIYKKPLAVVDADQIKRDVLAFIKSERLSPDSEIIYAQIIGAYDLKSETPADAISRAQIFSQKLDQSNDGLAKNASTTLSSTTSIAVNRVAVKFTFATNVGVKNNP